MLFRSANSPSSPSCPPPSATDALLMPPGSPPPAGATLGVQPSSGPLVERDACGTGDRGAAARAVAFLAPRNVSCLATQRACVHVRAGSNVGRTVVDFSEDPPGPMGHPTGGGAPMSLGDRCDEIVRLIDETLA